MSVSQCFPFPYSHTRSILSFPFFLFFFCSVGFTLFSPCKQTHTHAHTFCCLYAVNYLMNYLALGCVGIYELSEDERWREISSFHVVFFFFTSVASSFGMSRRKELNIYLVSQCNYRIYMQMTFELLKIQKHTLLFVGISFVFLFFYFCFLATQHIVFAHTTIYYS